MPKPDHKTAPEHVLRRIEAVRESDSTIRAAVGTHVFSVPAAGLLGAIQAAHLAGYAWPLEDVPTPYTDRLRELEQTDPSAAGKLRVQHSMDLQYEQRCVDRARGLVRWASEPTEAELAKERAEAERPQREAEAREAAIERRTTEILEANEAKRLATAKAKAREQAIKELADG